MQINSSNRNFKNIDALRGIAALLVVWQHTSESFIKLSGVATHGSLLVDISKDFDFGRIGIICFFLISGFVIPSSLKNHQKNPIKKFAIRRLFRLYPVYWLSLFLALSIALYSDVSINLKTILANTTMLQTFFNQTHMIGLYWTLQVELIFYFLCALLFYSKLLTSNHILFAIITILFSIFVLLQLLHVFYNIQLTTNKELQLLPYLISIMFLGSLYRKIYDGVNVDRTLNLFTLLATLMCLGLPLFLLLTSIFGLELVEHSYRFGVANVFGFVLFFMGLKLFNNASKLLLFLGTISYSVYLFHPLIMQMMMKIIHRFEKLQGFHVSVYMLIATILSILFAALIYKYLEKPAIDLAKRLTT